MLLGTATALTLLPRVPISWFFATILNLHSLEGVEVARVVIAETVDDRFSAVVDHWEFPRGCLITDYPIFS